VVICTPFELLAPTERRRGLEPGALGPRGPFALADDAEFQDVQAGRSTERDYWARRAARAAPLLGTPVDTRAFMQVLFDAPEVRIVRPQVRGLIEDARAAGVPVGLLTNDLHDFHGRAWVQRMDVFAAVDLTVDGSVTGVLKPDPGAYAIALEALGLPACEVVFLDDQPVNLRGATAVGLQAVPVDVTAPEAAVATARELLRLPTSAAD
jgi:putative hydrolase of the HAD superfamily